MYFEYWSVLNLFWAIYTYMSLSLFQLRQGLNMSVWGKLQIYSPVPMISSGDPIVKLFIYIDYKSFLNVAGFFNDSS